MSASQGFQCMQASMLDQASVGVLDLPTREEVEAIPMPQLPSLDPPGVKGHFESIAQFLQVRSVSLTGRRCVMNM